MAQHRVLVTLVVITLASAFVAVTGSGAGATPSITFSAVFCEPIPPATLDPACQSGDDPPGQSYDVVVSWATNSTTSPAVDLLDIGIEPATGSVTIPVHQGGRYAYTLAAGYTTGVEYRTAAVDVPILAPPTVAAYAPSGASGQNVVVDAFTGLDIRTNATPTINWTAGAAPAWAPTATMYTSIQPSSGFYPAGWSALTVPFAITSGLSLAGHGFQLRSCTDNTSTPAFCSPSVLVYARLQGATFQGGTRLYPAVGSTPTVSWQNPAGVTTPGNFAVIVVPKDPDLKDGLLTTTKSQGVPVPSAGVYDVWLESCKVLSFSPPARACAGTTVPEAAPTAGVVDHLPVAGRYVIKDQPTGVTITNGTTVTPVKAPATGILNPIETVTDLSSVSSGQVLFDVQTDPVNQQLVVGYTSSSSSFDFTPTPYTTVFSNAHAYSSLALPEVGGPGQVAFGPDGTAYSIGEQTSALMKVDPAAPSPVSSLRIPVHYSDALSAGTYPEDTPFAINTATSLLGESAISAAGRIWAVQGGGYPTSAPNHSRIVSYSPTSTLDPSIPGYFDPHFCAYSVPGNDNLAYDLAWDGHRIWFMENGTNAISWFDPGHLSCDSMLDYAVTTGPGGTTVAGAHSTCATNAPNCVHTIPSCGVSGTGICVHGPLAAGTLGEGTSFKIATDPDPTGGDDNHLWYSGLDGTLGELTYNASGTVTASVVLNSTSTPAYPASDPNPNDPDGTQPFGWDITAQRDPSTGHDTVYWVDAHDNDLVRYDATTSTFNEVHVPAAHAGDGMYTLAIMDGNVYFATQDDVGGADQLGYVTVSSWDAGAPSGVIYTGLASLQVPSQAQIGYHCFDGMAVDPPTHSIAMGDGCRAEVVILKP